LGSKKAKQKPKRGLKQKTVKKGSDKAQKAKTQITKTKTEKKSEPKKSLVRTYRHFRCRGQQIIRTLGNFPAAVAISPRHVDQMQSNDTKRNRSRKNENRKTNTWDDFFGFKFLTLVGQASQWQNGF
jgi:hypothetical protein